MPTQASWGAGLHTCAQMGQHSQRKPWRGVALGLPGPMLPAGALKWQCSDLPGPVWPEGGPGWARSQAWDPHSQRGPWEGARLRPRDPCGQRRPWSVGVQGHDPSRLLEQVGETLATFPSNPPIPRRSLSDPLIPSL